MSLGAVALAIAFSAAVISTTYAQQNQSTNNNSNPANNTNSGNMSMFPTRTNPGNITNTTASENITITPAK